MESDKQSRRHYSRAEKLAIVARFEQSGKSRNEFCSQEGINLHTLSNWIRAKKKKAGKGVRKQKSGFVAVKPIAIGLPEAVRERPFMRICFPDGRRITFYAEPGAALVKSLIGRI